MMHVIFLRLTGTLKRNAFEYGCMQRLLLRTTEAL